MAYFAVTYNYRDTDAINEVRPEHRRYTGSLADQGILIASGPYVGTDSAQALLLFTADDAASVEEFVANDPMKINDIIASYTVTEWNPVTGIFAS